MNNGQPPITTTTTQPSNVRIEGLLEECVKRKASDLHLQYGLPPILRIDGVLTPIAGMPNLNEQLIQSLIFATLDEEQRKILIKDKELMELHQETYKDDPSDYHLLTQDFIYSVAVYFQSFDKEPA